MKNKADSNLSGLVSLTGLTQGRPSRNRVDDSIPLGLRKRPLAGLEAGGPSRYSAGTAKDRSKNQGELRLIKLNQGESRHFETFLFWPERRDYLFFNVDRLEKGPFKFNSVFGRSWVKVVKPIESGPDRVSLYYEWTDVL